MKQVLFILLMCICLCPAAQIVDDDPRIPNEFIVLVKPGHTVKDITSTYPAVKVKEQLSKQMNLWLLENNNNPGGEDILLALQRNEHIQIAQFNHRVQQRALVLPNDTFFNMQWNLYNTGQNGGTPGADINAPEAWDINHNNLTVNGDTIVVAVIDVGYDFTHPDINFFHNHHDIPGNDIDDDGNGYIDDFDGWNPMDNTGNIHSFGTDPHSMHISGIIGAIGDNHIGVAGVCWGAQVMRLCGSGSDEAKVVAAYAYVLTMRNIYNNTNGTKGAFIVATNSSFGIDNGKPADYPIWCAMYDSMGAAGILSATATSNSKINVDTKFDIPTTCPSKWMIAVTNTDNKDRLIAAYGKENIDLSAPGTNIYSTYSSNGYGYRSGASMSTPHVAGAIAAMYAAACPRLIDDYYAYPDSIALMVRQMLLDGTTPRSSLHNLTVTGGRLNLYHAIRNLEEYNCNNCNYSLQADIQHPTCNNTCDGAIAITATGGSSFSYTQANLCAGYYPLTLTDTVGCERIKNIELAAPDTIVINSIQITPPLKLIPGNIIVNATAGNYQLEYSLDGINYQQTATFSIGIKGYYTIYIRSENGCIVQQTVLAAPTGIDDIDELAEWNIFPNPATDVLNVQLNLPATTTVQLSLTGILGEVLWQATLQTGEQKTAVPLNNLPAGVYFLSVKAGGYSSKKFVIAR